MHRGHEHLRSAYQQTEDKIPEESSNVPLKESQVELRRIKNAPRRLRGEHVQIEVIAGIFYERDADPTCLSRSL